MTGCPLESLGAEIIRVQTKLSEVQSRESGNMFDQALARWMPSPEALQERIGKLEAMQNEAFARLGEINLAATKTNEDKTMLKEQALKLISVEIGKAQSKFPTWPTDPLHAIGVVNEEVGELNKELLQLTYEPHKGNQAAVFEEAVQAAAMAVRFLMSIEAYDYKAGKQHRD